MVVWSSFRRLTPLLSTTTKNYAKNVQAKPNQCLTLSRLMSGHHMEIVPNRFQWAKFKDMLHFYTLVGALPWVVMLTIVNIFIGPATLAEIPEDYVPQEHEYYRHPVSRFIAKYILPSPQEDYERTLNVIYEEDEKVKLRKLEKKVYDLMASKNDYKVYWHRPVSTKYHKMHKEMLEREQDENIGEDFETRFHVSSN